MRKWSSFMLLAAAVLFGCGGGGSSTDAGIQEQTQSFQLGFVRGDAPTTVTLQVAKPFYTEGTVDLAEAPAGPFQPAAGMLPMPLANGHEVSLWITFTPPAPADATQEGTIRLLFRSTISGKVVPVTLQFRAQVETPSARLMQTDVSAGTVMLGDTGRLGVWVENTSVATPVTVTEVTLADGDFSIDPAAPSMPVLVAPGSKFYVRLLYSPEALGTSSSLVRVSHSASVNPLEATLTGTGAENFSMQVLETPVSAGNVVVGETVQLVVSIANPSVATPVTVTELTLPPGSEFSIAPDAPALPILMTPGTTLDIPLVYAPQGVGDASSLLQIRHSASGDPLEATVTGTGIAPQINYTYDLWLDENFESGWQDVYVPAEGVSIFLEAKGDPSSLIDLIGFEGPGGVVYENSEMTGPLVWQSFYPAGGLGYLNVELPNSDQLDVQLVPGGGWYKFRLRDSNWVAGSLQVRVTITQRTVPTVVEQGTLDVRVFLADGLKIDAADPMGDATLAEVMKTIDAILGTNGIRLGNLSFTVLDPTYDTVDETTMDEMLSSNTTNLPEGALNLFFVTDMSYWGAAIAGIAGATPGPAANGTPYSGVVIDFNQADAISVGAAAAHEIGHYLGHFDMGEEGWLLLADEAYAVLRHPLLRPGLPQDFLSPEASTDYDAIYAAIDNMPGMDTECGTCTRWPARP